MAWDSRTGGGVAPRSESALEAAILDYVDSRGGVACAFVRSSGADDSSRFAAAITALPAAGGIIYALDTSYKIGTLTFPAAPKDVMIVGAGLDVTTFHQNNANIGTSTVSMFDIPAKGTLRMYGLTVDGTTTASTGLMRLIHSPGDGSSGLGGVIDLERVRLTNYSYGVWEEDEAVYARDCIFDGGLAGVGIGSASTGVQHSFTGIGKLTLDNCLFTGNGVSTSNQHHNIYCADSVRVTASSTDFMKLYGTGFQAQHNGGSTSGIESKYVNCYFGPGASANASQGLATAPGMILTLVNCTVEASDTAIYAQQNSTVNLLGCHFTGTCAASSCAFAYAGTGVEFVADDCTFNTTVSGGYQFYLFSNTGKLTVRNSRFTGAVAYDVNVAASLTGCEVDIAGGNTHTGAVAGAVRFFSGARASITGHNRFLGTYSDAAIRNGTASTLAILNLYDNDFSQAGGASVTLTVTPTTLRAARNYGSVGYKTEGGATFTSTPGAVTTLNIAHGLAQTPTIFDARPNNTNARGAPLYSVTADGTNVILTFASALTTATSYAWNWHARFQA